MKAYSLEIDKVRHIYGYAHLNAGQSTQHVDRQRVHELQFYDQVEIRELPENAVCQRCHELILIEQCQDLLYQDGDRVRLRRGGEPGTVTHGPDHGDFADEGNIWVKFDRDFQIGERFKEKFDREGQWIEAKDVIKI